MSLFEAMGETLAGRKPWEPMTDEPQSIDEVRMPDPEPDEDDDRTTYRSMLDDYDGYEAGR